MRQENVRIKTIQRNFCHAKTYIYKDDDQRKNFQVIGSANLTEAGLGLKESANIELNRAETGASNDYHELTAWFQDLWKHSCKHFDLKRLPVYVYGNIVRSS